LEPGDAITFVYQAESPGFPKPGLSPLNENVYDANPFVVLTDVKRIKGKVIVYGLNVNYLRSRMDRGKTVLSLRLDRSISKRNYVQMIHAYRLDRLQSSIYKAVNIISDKEILTTIPLWREVKQSLQ